VRNLIVNYLPFSVTEQMLHAMFVPYGTVERTKLMTESNGQSKCFGFVRFSTSTAAHAAVAALDGREIDGKRVRVSLARPDGVNPAQRRTNVAQQVMGAASMVAALSEVNLYVSGLAPHVTREVLRDAFAAFGTVTDASVLTEPGSTLNKGIGFVRFINVNDADRAIAALDGQTPPALAAKPLNVRIADSTKRAMGVGGPMRNPMGMGAVAAAAAMRFSPYGAFPGGANPAMYNPALLAGGGMAGGMAAYQQQLAGAAAAGQQAAAAAAAAAAAYGGANPGAMAMFGGMPPQAFAGMGLPGAASGAVPSSTGTVGVPLFVHGVPREADEAWLTQVFSPYGQVLQVRIVRDPQTNVSKGFGFAHLPTLNEAYAAIAAVNGATVNGKVLTVSLKQAKS
jgi:protein sex-lethal